MESPKEMNNSSVRAADAEDGVPRFEREDTMPGRCGDYNEPKPSEPKNAGSRPNDDEEDESSNLHRRNWFPQMKYLSFIVLFLIFAIVLGE